MALPLLLTQFPRTRLRDHNSTQISCLLGNIFGLCRVLSCDSTKNVVLAQTCRQERNHHVGLHQGKPEQRRRRPSGLLKCMAWAGTGALCVMKGGVLKSFALSDVMQHNVGDFKGDLSFVQISDSHIGFQQGGQSGRDGYFA